MLFDYRSDLCAKGIEDSKGATQILQQSKEIFVFCLQTSHDLELNELGYFHPHMGTGWDQMKFGNFRCSQTNPGTSSLALVAFQGAGQ